MVLKCRDLTYLDILSMLVNIRANCIEYSFNFLSSFKHILFIMDDTSIQMIVKFYDLYLYEKLYIQHWNNHTWSYKSTSQLFSDSHIRNPSHLKIYTYIYKRFKGLIFVRWKFIWVKENGCQFMRLLCGGRMSVMCKLRA